MASTSRESEVHDQANGVSRVKIIILASEWGSNKCGLSTMIRELAIQLAKSSSAEITFFVPQCSDEDKKEALRHNVHILKATPLAGYGELEWLSFPPEDHQIDIIVGHGVKLGRQAQVIRNSHKCKWVQVVHSDPEAPGMFESYSNPVSTSEEKHSLEVKLCEMADFVVGVGPKLCEAFRSYLRWCSRDQTVFELTPGLFEDFADVEQVTEERKNRSVLVFGHGDAADFELKGFDIAARAVASLPETHLVLRSGAPKENLNEVAQRFRDHDVPTTRLKVKSYDKSRDSLKRLFCEVDLALLPSRTESFGFAGLGALSAGLPVLVSKHSGFGEALSKVTFGSSFVIDSEDPEVWTAAIKNAWDKGRQNRLEEAEALRSSYERKYSWSKQSCALLFKMINLVRARLRLKIDGEVTNGRGAPATATGMGMKPHEPHSLVQDDATLLPIMSNQPEEVRSSSKVGNESIPSLDEIFRMGAVKYLRGIDPSKPEEFNGYLQYLEESRKLLIVDAQVGSLIITVEIRSLQILEDLWEDYRTGHLNEMAQKFLVPEDVLKEFGVSEVRLTTTIAEEEYRACRDFFERPVDPFIRRPELWRAASAQQSLGVDVGNSGDDEKKDEEEVDEGNGCNVGEEVTEGGEQLSQQLHEVQTEEQQHLVEEANKIRVYRGQVTSEGTHLDLKLGAVHLTFPPDAVSEPTSIVVHKWKSSACSPQLQEHEAIVSNVIEISTTTNEALQFKVGVKLFFSHCAPDLQGYELVIKRSINKETNDWKEVEGTVDARQLSDIEDEYPKEVPDFSFPAVQADIAECSIYTVICRLKPSPTYTISSSGGWFNHPDYPGVAVRVPKKAVSVKSKISMELKVQEVPNDEFEGRNVYVGPILRISCTQGIEFLKPVTIQLPVAPRVEGGTIPDPSICRVRALFLRSDGENKGWVDSTDDLEIPARFDGSSVTFQVKRFPGYSCDVSWHNHGHGRDSGIVRYLSNMIWTQPRLAYFFAYFRPSECFLRQNILYLICCPAHLRDRVKYELKNEGIRSHEASSRKRMIPGRDKAFVSVSGGISPVNEEDMADICLRLEPDGQSKATLLIRLISDQEYGFVEFRSTPEPVKENMLAKLPLRLYQP